MSFDAPRYKVPQSKKIARIPPCVPLCTHAPHEQVHWNYDFDSDTWTRRSEGRKDVRLQVKKSSVDGLGVFSVEGIPRGTLIGKVTGTIVGHPHCTARAACEARIPVGVLRDRLIVLQSEEDELYSIVDVRHSCWPFEFMNSGRSNVYVDPVGYCFASDNIDKGKELLWDYGSYHIIARS